MGCTKTKPKLSIRLAPRVALDATASDPHAQNMLRFRFLWGAWACALFALLHAVHAEASIVQALDLEELSAQADCIVLGRVVWSEPVLHPDGTISTWSRIEVEKTLRGEDPNQSEILVETLGGEVGDIGMRVVGEPSLAVGERAVVFVRDDGRSIFRPVGMAQGVMRVSREGSSEVVKPSRSNVSLVRRNETGSLVRSDGPLRREERLERFLSRVRAIVGAQDRRGEQGSDR